MKTLRILEANEVGHGILIEMDAGYVSPKTGAKVSDLLTDDEIGQVINCLSDAYFNRKMQARAKRIGEGF